MVEGKTISWQWKRKKVKGVVEEEENKGGSGRERKHRRQWER
jgi:hypothetical protein